MPSCLLNKGAYEYLKSTRMKKSGNINVYNVQENVFYFLWRCKINYDSYYECEYATYQFYHKGSVNINLDIYNPLWFMLD